MKKLNSVTEVGAWGRGGRGSIIYIRYKRRQLKGADLTGGKFRKVGKEAGKENPKIKKTKLKMFIPVASPTHFTKAIFKLFV